MEEEKKKNINSVHGFASSWTRSPATDAESSTPAAAVAAALRQPALLAAWLRPS